MKLTIVSGFALICSSLMTHGCGLSSEESSNSGPSVDDNESVETADEKTKSPSPSKSGEDDSTPDSPADSVGEEDSSAEATGEEETSAEEVGEEATGEETSDGDEVGEEDTGAEEDTGPPPEEPCGGWVNSVAKHLRNSVNQVFFPF